MSTVNVSGITYTKPEVRLAQSGRTDVAEIAGRIAYDSFLNSEHEQIRNFDIDYDFNQEDVSESELLNSLAWVHHHHSVLEHINLSYLIKGTSRGTLIELTRHRIASYTVRSTRYTMSSIINAFVVSMIINIDTSDYNKAEDWFINSIKKLDLLVTVEDDYNEYEYLTIFGKLIYQYRHLGKEEFIKNSIAKSSLSILESDMTYDEMYNALESGKKKRNVGDIFKHIVTDNWKVDMIVTFNLRSLKNYFQLRNSGAAFFQIQWLSQEMMKVTPKKYLDLIVKSN